MSDGSALDRAVQGREGGGEKGWQCGSVLVAGGRREEQRRRCEVELVAPDKEKSRLKGDTTKVKKKTGKDDRRKEQRCEARG